MSTPTLGHRVDIVRARRGITRTALAVALGLDRSTVTKWSTTGSAPRDIEAVAKALGVGVAEIFAARGKVRTPARRRAA